MTDPLELLTEKLRSATLCALPQSAAQMIQLSKDPNNGPQEYAVPISADLGLATQVLRFVNSSFFGFRYKITSIHMALSLTSVRTIKNFVLWSGLYAIMPNPKCGPFSIRVLFQDSLRRGIFSKRICEILGDIDPDESFLCAILQDVSIPIVGQIWNKEYEEMITVCNNSMKRLSQLERERLGWDHAQASAILAKQWNLDEHISDIIRSHTDYDFTNSPSNSEEKKKMVTALSSLLPSVAASQWHEVEQFIFGFNQLFHDQPPDLELILKNTDTASLELMQMINLGSTPRYLVDYLHDYYHSFQNVISLDHVDLVSGEASSDIPASV